MDLLTLLQYEFAQKALLASLLVSIACGIMGPLIIINRQVAMAGGITHAAYGGLGLAGFLGIPMLLGASFFTLLMSLLIAFLTQKNKASADAVIGVIWAFGMSFGIILIDLTPGYARDLLGFLFGSIITVSPLDLYLMGVSDLFFLALILLFYRQFCALSFDPVFASLRGVKILRFHYLLVAMMAFCVVLVIQVVGLIMVVALLCIPSFLAQMFCKKLGAMMLASSALSLCFCLAGFYLSFTQNLSSGACIIMVACTVFFAVFAVFRGLGRV